jgi:hypothetical protein
MKAGFLKCVFVVVFIVTSTFSCTDRPADNSLSVDAYVTLGMPDVNKKWNMTDYTRAYNLLAKMKWEHPLELPVKDSKKSGLLFDHMVSLEYLSFLQDSAMSLNEKAGRISEFTGVYDYWMDIYIVPTLKRNHYHREILDLQIFNLRLMEAMVNLAHQINESRDPADVALQFGYQSIKENYLSGLHNGLKIQRNTSEFLKQDLDRMTDTIYTSVMRNKGWMDSIAVSEVKRSLQLVMDSTSSHYIRNKYKSLEKSLGAPDLRHLKSQYLTP